MVSNLVSLSFKRKYPDLAANWRRNLRARENEQGNLRLAEAQPEEGTSTQIQAKRVVAVIPAYNEDRFIGSVILKTLRHVDCVIVVDDGSHDDTADVARLAGANVIVHPSNRGKGAAMQTGLIRAREYNPEVTVLLDADGQHQPTDIPTVIQPILDNQADMVVGSRFQGVESKIPVWRRFGIFALTLATNVASGVHLTDSQSGFRAFNRRVLEIIDFESDGFSVESEMQFIVNQHKLRITEMPVSCLYVEKPKRNPFTQGLQVINGIINLISQARPLLFFGLSGFLTSMLGAGGWWWTVDIYNHTGEFALGYALISTCLVILGVLTIFEGITLHTLRQVMVSLPRQTTLTLANEAEKGEELSLPLPHHTENRKNGRKG